MRFREFLIKQLVENVNQDRTTLTFQAKAINPSLTDEEINDLLTQIEQEENEKYTDKTHAEYTRSTFARKRLKELLSQTKQTKIVKEDANTRKAKGINAKYYKWILKVNKTMPMSNIDRSVFDYLTANNISPETNKSYEEIKRESDAWHREKYEKAKSTEYKLKLDDPKYAHLIEPIRDMYMVQVTKEDQVAEGKNMKHCAGDICTLTRTNAFYSLRDRNNIPHVTIEIDNNEIIQIRSKANQIVKLNYSPYVVDWLLKHKEIDINTLDDMQISDENFNKLINRFKPNVLLEIAAALGKMDYILESIKLGATAYYNAIEASANNGHTDIVYLLLNKVKLKKELDYQMHINIALSAASKGGFLNLAKSLIENGANNFNTSMIEASENDNVELIKLLIDKGADNFNSSLHSAVYNNKINAINLLIKYADNFTMALAAAAKNNKEDLVKQMISLIPEETKTKTEPEPAIMHALLNKNKNIINLLFNKFKNINFNKVLLELSDHYTGDIEQKELLDLLIKNYNVDISIIFTYRIIINKKETSYLLKKYGGQELLKKAIKQTISKRDDDYWLSSLLTSAEEYVNNSIILYALQLSAKYDRENMLNYLIKKYHIKKDILNIVLKTATKYGKQDIIALLFDKYQIKNKDYVIKLAQKYKQDHIVKLFK